VEVAAKTKTSSYLLGISYVNLLLPSGPLPTLIRFQLKMHIFFVWFLANVHTKTIKIIYVIIFKFLARSSFLGSSATKDRANRLTALMAPGRHVFGTAKMSEKRVGMKTHYFKIPKVEMKNAPEFCPEDKKGNFELNALPRVDVAPVFKGFSLYLAYRLKTLPISCVLLLTQEEIGAICTQVILDSNWTKTPRLL